MIRLFQPPAAVIFDLDGVLLESPQEEVWREALAAFVDPSRFTKGLYDAVVAGKPRLVGARDALEALAVPDAARKAAVYARAKEVRLLTLIQNGDVFAFRDAVRLVQKLAQLGWPMAVTSSSSLANARMAAIRLPGGGTLLDAFSVNVCGRDLPKGKPDPAIFLIAASELGMHPELCVVLEDAAAGIVAATAAGMSSIGVARAADAARLRAAGADLVVKSLDEVSVGDLLPTPAQRSFG